MEAAERAATAELQDMNEGSEADDEVVSCDFVTESRPVALALAFLRVPSLWILLYVYVITVLLTQTVLAGGAYLWELFGGTR
ncbi:MAG: hypothetical protein ACKVVT_09940 [Dehalococcoidia bacterium]